MIPAPLWHLGNSTGPGPISGISVQEQWVLEKPHFGQYVATALHTMRQQAWLFGVTLVQRYFWQDQPPTD